MKKERKREKDKWGKVGEREEEIERERERGREREREKGNASICKDLTFYHIFSNSSNI
jgi:hypothetical protein